MPRLEWLDLIGTPISPSGFDELHGYENLKVVLRGHNHPAKQSPAAKP
jgi:hypothetical protein